MKRKPVKFQGRLYKARPTRGPLNKDLTLDDLKALKNKLKGVQVKYNHGDTEAIGDKTIGTILDAYIDNEEHLCVSGQLASSEEIGEPLFERIRTELLTKELPMLSMYWNSAAENPGAPEEKRIAIPDTRWMKEVSLVAKGLYPEANIVAVAASDTTQTAWKVASSLLALGEVDAPTVNTRTMATPAEKHAAFLKHMDKVLSDEEKMRFNNDATYREEVFATVFPELIKVNQGYAKKAEQEKIEYVGKELEDTEKLVAAFKPHWKEPAEAEWHENHMKASAKDFENKATWQNMKRLYSKVADVSSERDKLFTEVAELRKLTTPGTPATPDERPQEVAQAASEARNLPKKQVNSVQTAYQNTLLARLAAAQRN
jgi:hypothetical protein